ncbi:hypothetical protein L1987_48342 [Smallanthus sonchifolius]|uniref:Uncharacterized protein n=1 Tax=Smallanthus sonchifolius TaxID=185202 RepID=A0ACB9FSN7_9ASTR|nr:hypothetical protein L1987_48342 [Smallanthus sonchifolius]
MEAGYLLKLSGTELNLHISLPLIEGFYTNEYHRRSNPSEILHRNRVWLKKNPSLNAKLSDISIGTSAAPIFLPSHPFHVNDSEGKLLREYDLIDGGVVANNPVRTELAIKEVISGGSRDGCKFFVLSVGTGSQDFQEKYKATKSSHWGIFGWLFGGAVSIPLLDAASSSSSYMADYHVSTLLQLLGSENTYLRIQDDTLSDDIASMDLGNKENIEKLVKVGKELLKKPMTRMNPQTGLLEHHPHITNEMALDWFAELLHEERRSRMK